jgi:hypothetical protein
MTNADQRAERGLQRAPWFEQLAVPLVMLVANAAVTYGILTTQMQWIRADLDRQQRNIERIEMRIFRNVP